MFNKKKRGLLASAGALVTAAALAFSGAAAAHAAPGDIVTGMPQTSAVIITKLEQPDTAGIAANGLDKNLTGGIDGVTFKAYAVPVEEAGVPLVPGTNAWQKKVASMNVADAQSALGAVPPTAYREGTTANGGVIAWDTDRLPNSGGDLERGLYLIKETATPPGVVASGDFLIAVPLTHPTALNSWLDTIHVYPKNRTLEGIKTVENATDYSVGNTVTWSINLDNPSTRHQASGAYVPTDLFQILDTIKDEYLSTTVAGVNVTVPGGLVKNDDYTVNLLAGDGTNGTAVGSTQIQVTFTEAGRAKLAVEMNKADGVDNVIVTIDTVVKKVGVIDNAAQFYSSTAQTVPADVPGTSVKYGNITLQKLSSKGDIDRSGAEFRVYLSEAAARAKSNTVYDSVTNPDGYLVTAEQPNGLWVTDTDGEISVGGFRYSAFANGGDVSSSVLNQTYWLSETKALSGHQLLGQPYPFTVDSHDGSNVVEITNVADGGFVLPLTGGTGTLLLTVLGVGILAVVLIVARRRNTIATAE